MAPAAWHVATLVAKRAETPSAATLIFDCPSWPGHRAGQHVDVRLTGEDGYQAQRSYSIASATEDDRLELTVERIAQGEVSPYLVEAMLPAADVIYAGELGPADGFAPFTTYTRAAPPGWTVYRRRIDRAMLEEIAFAPAERPRIFVCGPTAFVETASTALVELGHDPAGVKTERFGPTG